MIPQPISYYDHYKFGSFNFLTPLINEFQSQEFQNFTVTFRILSASASYSLHFVFFKRNPVNHFSYELVCWSSFPKLGCLFSLNARGRVSVLSQFNVSDFVDSSGEP